MCTKIPKECKYLLLWGKITKLSWVHIIQSSSCSFNSNVNNSICLYHPFVLVFVSLLFIVIYTSNICLFITLNFQKVALLRFFIYVPTCPLFPCWDQMVMGFFFVLSLSFSTFFLFKLTIKVSGNKTFEIQSKNKKF